jgi:hypothetical protein
MVLRRTALLLAMLAATPGGEELLSLALSQPDSLNRDYHFVGLDLGGVEEVSGDGGEVGVSTPQSLNYPASGHGGNPLRGCWGLRKTQ